MNGTGTQTFSGNAIDYTGTTIVNSGRLVFSANDDCWTTRIEIAAGATVEVARDNADTFENQGNCTVTGAGTYLKTGNGTMDMNWSNRGTVAMTSGGHIWVKEGTLRLGYGFYSDWMNNKADLTVETGAMFDLWDNNTTTAGVIVDALQGGGQIVRTTYVNTGNLTVGWMVAVAISPARSAMRVGSSISSKTARARKSCRVLIPIQAQRRSMAVLLLSMARWMQGRL